jgi:hypothetical protein
MTEPGKYDDAATVARNMTDADMVLLIVHGGTYGHGFTVQAVHPDLVKMVPDILEEVARQIRAGQK